jgi:hypothetical protein
MQFNKEEIICLLYFAERRLNEERPTSFRRTCMSYLRS